MPDDEGLRPLLVQIYPYKYNEFIYKLSELDYFERVCDVEIWDISLIIDKKFADSIPEKVSGRSNITKFTSLYGFLLGLKNLRKDAASRKILIFNYYQTERFVKVVVQILIKRFLNNVDAIIIDFFTGGWLDMDGEPGDGSTEEKRSYFRKFLDYMKGITSLQEFKIKFFSIFSILFGKIIKAPTTHVMVVGTDWIEKAKRLYASKKSIKFVHCNSMDFSNNLITMKKHRQYKKSEQKTIVLLDNATPISEGDGAYLGIKQYVTSDVWYPSLSCFLDRLELETGFTVEIAGHYKTNFSSIEPLFGNRHVHYGCTAELVRNCEFVITRISSSISYAVINNKPIIFIYSDQYLPFIDFMHIINQTAKNLNTLPVNIDDPTTDIKSLLKINQTKYNEYLHRCLSSECSGRPNYQIILEDILQIKTSPDLFN